MNLPNDLKEALESLFAAIPRSLLLKASQELSERYRSPERDKLAVFINSKEQRLAYLAVRMPATYAVVRRVLNECKQRCPDFNPKSLCDIGAGPGTASWAAQDVFSGISQANLVEKDEQWFEIGKNLMSRSKKQALLSALWKQADIQQVSDFEKSDLVVLSYVVGELSLDSFHSVLEKAWQASDELLVIIEPGTPHGFERIRMARRWLIEHQGFLAAPCPHHKQCPMKDNDWCHFSERLERSQIHMAAKDAVLGYEDEKFSYIAASKKMYQLPDARILRHPQRHSGHIDFILCAQNGLEKVTISRRMGELYKRSRKLEWGDVLEGI